HALNGVDWAECLDRVLDVANEHDVDGAPFYYVDNDAVVQNFPEKTAEELDRNSKRIQSLEVELAELKLKYAETTEAKDEALRQLAEAHRLPIVVPSSAPPVTETKHYTDGSSATGP